MFSLLLSTTAAALSYPTLDNAIGEIDRHDSTSRTVVVGLQGGLLVEAWKSASQAQGDRYRPVPVSSPEEFFAALSLNSAECGMLIAQGTRGVETSWLCLSDRVASFAGTTAAMPTSGTTAEPSGYQDVVLVGGGEPTVMNDMRKYTDMVTPGLFGLGFKARYHHLINDNTSFIIGAGLGGATASAEELEENLNVLRYQVLGGLDFHPVGNGFHGFYLGPQVLFRHGGFQWLGDEETSWDRLFVRGIMGYRWVFDPGGSIAVGVGGGVRWLETTNGLFSSSSLFSGRGALEMNLSWAF